MNLKKCPVTILLLICLFGISCSNEQESVNTTEQSLDPSADNYFLINSLGDTVPTGVPIPITGKRLISNVQEESTSRFFPQKSVPLRIPNDIQAANSSKTAPISKTVKTLKLGEDGIQLPDKLEVVKKTVPVSQQRPFQAGALQIRENAVANIQYLGLEEGISEYFLYSIFEDSRGHLWFGDRQGILNRYDGQNLTYFPIPGGFSENINYIRSLLEDQKGNLWVGTNTGICRYDGHDFTFYTNLGGEINWEVSSMIEDQHGTIWFGSLNRGLVRFDPDSDDPTFINYTTKQGLPHHSIKTITEDRQGAIWIGTDGGGASRFEYNIPGTLGGQLTNYNKDKGLIHNQINTIIEDSKGNIWFGSQGGGACKFDGTKMTYYTIAEGLCADVVQTIFEDSQGNIWFGNRACGLTYFDGSTFQHYSEGQGTNSMHANVITEDKSQNVWVGTNEGLHRFGFPKFRHYTLELESNFLEPNAISEDKEGRLWFDISWKKNGLLSFDNQLFSFFIEEATPYETYQVFKNKQGDLLLVFEEELYYFDGQDFTSRSLSEALYSSVILTLLETKNGALFFGTSSGLIHDNGEFFTSYTVEDGLPENTIHSLAENEKGDLWIGFQNGLGHFNGKDLTLYTNNEGLPDNWCQVLLHDSQGNIWIGTKNGLSCFDGQAFINYTTQDGLVDNRVRTLTEDNAQNIWVGTQNGLSLLVPSKAGKEQSAYKIYNYGKEDGLKQAGFLNRSAFLDSRNRIWWGKTKGLMMLDLDHFKLPTLPPQLHLDRIEIDQQFVDFRKLEDTAYQNELSFGSSLAETYDSVAPFFNYPINPKLPYGLNHIAFYFSGIDWAGPDKVKYAYRLVGLDKDWSIPQSDPKIEYRNLSHGAYTLQVKAIGAAQVWSDVFEYKFRIYPPWWYSWWAYTLYVIAFLSLLSGIFLYQRRRWQLQANFQLEQEKANRLKELDQFKSRFYTNITHEFRTPLTVIKGMTDQISGPDKVKNLIKRNSYQLLNLVNQLLDLSKLETNTLSIKWIQGDVIPYLQYLTESCHSLAEQKNINLAFFAKEEKVVMDYDEHKLNQVLINLLSNAIKFTPKYGSVKVIAERVKEEEASLLKLSVKDTGKGISTDQLSQIFNRFYQVDDSSTRQGEGTGIGLALVKELVNLLEGRIDVQSQVGKGSTFSVYLPIHQQSENLATGDWSAVSVMEVAANGNNDTVELAAPTTNEEKPLVLIIEDNADVTEYIISCLASDYNLQTAPNGKVGVEKALEIVPDVILSDVMMPEMDGFEVCQHLKTDRRTSHIPIVLLTAKATQADKVTGLSHGADAYLTKPFDKEELLVRLQNLAAVSQRLRERLSTIVPATEAVSEVEDQEATFLKEVNEIIESKLSDELFDTNHLCRAIAMSRTQLHRKLKALTGQSTASYIRTIRLKKAKSLLETTDLPIGDIASEIGYKDFSHFSRSFLKEFGVQPSETRK